MRRTLIATFAAMIALAFAVPALAAPGNGSGGVTGPAFYVDGELYRTVVTPTDLSGTGAPLHSFDTIYAIPAQDHNVATAAPGDAGYNGGRWMVHLLGFSDYDAALAAADSNGSGDFDSAAEVETAMDLGFVATNTVVAQFECPVIPVPRGRA